MSEQNNEVATLVEKAKTGNRSSLEKLIDLFHQDVFRMVYYRTRSKMDAEDLTQEIFIKMINSLSGLKDSNRFRAWLFKMTLNRIRDFHRKKNILAFFGTSKEIETINPGAQNSESPLTKLEEREFKERLHEYTSRLSRWERETFLLRFVDQLGIREIAEVMNRNENTVKTHLYRALKKMKQDLKFRKLLAGENL